MTELHFLGLAIGWILAVFIGLLGAPIIYLILANKINLSKLISETDGKGSMSRFQLLIFTFIISMILFYIIVSANPPAFPSIPPEILWLLGISGGTYAVSKGIQFTSKGSAAGSSAAAGAQLVLIAVAPQNPPLLPARATQQFVATGTYDDSTSKDITGTVQ